MVDYFLFISMTDVSFNRFYIYYASSRTIINDYALVFWTEHLFYCHCYGFANIKYFVNKNPA